VPNVLQVRKPLSRENSASAGGSLKVTQVRVVKYSAAASQNLLQGGPRLATPKDSVADDNSSQGSDSTSFRDSP